MLFLQHDSVFESYGGVQYYIDDFLSFLSNLYGPNSLKVLLAQRGDSFQMGHRPYSIETIKLSQGLLRKLENRFSPRFFIRSLKIARELKPSVIIASHLSLAPMAAILSRLTATPFLVIAYGFEVWGNFQPQDKWALKKADGIISISDWTKTILEKQGFNPHKISIVHPSLSPDMASLNVTTQSRNRTSLNHSTIKLLTLARLDSSEQYKGHDHVLKALKQINETQSHLSFSYTIQGNGDDLPRLKQLTHEYGLEKIVTFLPAVNNREDLKATYQSHDIFIMPSRFGYWNKKWKGEGFGIVYVEAALFGVPSIAYRCGGVTDIIENQSNGLLVEPDNIEALAEAIVGLSQDKERLIELGRRARETALEKFTPSKIQREIEKAFNSYPFLKSEPNLS